MRVEKEKLGGGYPTPIIHFSDEYNRGDLNEADSWRKISNSFGDIIATFEHISKPSLPVEGAKPTTFNYSAPVFVARDGLIATELPAPAKNNKEALIILSHHLNSFISALNFGGLYQAPFTEKVIGHVKKEGNEITHTTSGGDQFSTTTLTRTLHRLRPPLLDGTPMIDHSWAPQVCPVSKLETAYLVGDKILESLNLVSHEVVISLEAYTCYTVHNWNNAVLLGWSFTEILIDKVWDISIVQAVTNDEKNRRDRLKDYRTYTAAIKTEFLYKDSLLNIDLYNALNSLRGIRNRLIHEAIPAFQQDAKLMFDTIQGLIKVLTGSQSNFVNPGYSQLLGFTK